MRMENIFMDYILWEGLNNMIKNVLVRGVLELLKILAVNIFCRLELMVGDFIINFFF